MNAMSMCAAVVVFAATASVAGAQVTKTIDGVTVVVTATVVAIERSSREVTVEKADGNHEVVYVSEDIKRFDTLKVGDKITVRYYETLVLKLKAPGEKDVDTSTSATVPSERPAGTAAHQQTITATITAIDSKVPSITFVGPRGWTYSSRVKDTNALAKVKVGDKVDITWTEALIMSIDDAK